MLFFKWIRDQIRQAVVAGFQDGMEDLNNMAAANAPATSDKLLGRFDRVLSMTATEAAGPVEKKAKR